MAVAQGKYIVSPSSDIKTKAELDSIKIESGLYYCTESVTINAENELGSSIGVTSSRWTVICISNEQADKLACFTQIWIDSSTPRSMMFIRYANSSLNAFTDFSMLVTSDYLRENAVLNTHTEPVHIVVSDTQPTAETGITKIWIDTSGN